MSENVLTLRAEGGGNSDRVLNRVLSGSLASPKLPSGGRLEE